MGMDVGVWVWCIGVVFVCVSEVHGWVGFSVEVCVKGYGIRAFNLI